jgi:hypothetical protein
METVRVTCSAFNVARSRPWFGPDEACASSFPRQKRASRHRFLEPIHNVKDWSDDRHRAEARIRFPYIPWKRLGVVEPVGIEPTT